jgi:hypothetical protein
LGPVLLVVLIVVGLLCVPVLGEGFVRSVGLRFTLPGGDRPLLVGLEATTDLGFGLGRAAFFLSAKGEGMFLIGAGVRLTEEDAETITYLQFQSGFYYFDLAAFAPSLLVGLGVAYESIALDPLLVGLEIDFVYPIALPIPLLSASFGWAFP